MTIQLVRSDPSSTIVLSRDLVWTDRYSWAQIVDSEERTVTGALIVEPWVLDGGQPITLESPADDFGLVTRSQVEQLESWADEPGLEMALAFHGTNYDVMFRHADGRAVQARAIWPAGAPQPADLMALTLRLRRL